MRRRKAASRIQPTTTAPEHPGEYVREHGLKPRDMSVTDAAKVIGVSRPGVSGFLNGKVAATPEMAARIERAFQIPAQKILDMQAAFDAAQAKEKGAPSNARLFVPPYLAIKANQLVDWATHNTLARSRLAVFLRTLVHSTGVGLTNVSFPGNDDAERPGWDGYIEASEGTPYIPAGKSGWEFGVNADVKTKADGDFAKSIKALPKHERAEITFVFVTPRVWPGKEAWAAKARASNQWKDVRVCDAQDIEAWLEQSIPGQAWFANETRIPAQDVRGLEKAWADWAEVAKPVLSPELFKTALKVSRSTLVSRLTQEPSNPIAIAADSAEEALAFLAAAFASEEDDKLAAIRDRVLIFDKPGVLPRLALGKAPFVAVVHTREVERELAPLSRSLHSIVIYPRNAANVEPEIVLEPATHETFRSALGAMGKDRDEIEHLGNVSGRSLTVLRRQLSNVAAVKTPEWAADQGIAASLVPFLFVGAWDSRNVTDCEALSLLAERPYAELEKECQKFSQLNDPPVWSIGTFRGVISKIDLLHAIAGVITPDELRRYFSLAKMVLGEDDPSLDLEMAERWAASIHGKTRDFSGAFREGISETLVLLAVRGNALFKKKLGFDCEFEASQVVRSLLTPLTMRTLEANDRDLPTYSEAAPEAFLSIIEEDLKTADPKVLGLLKPVDTSVFGRGSSRTGLLWALENLAWNPATLGRTVDILGRLSQIELNDNLVNKPTHSLKSIFRDWMPQTAATTEERLAVMKRLADKFPDVAWEICTAQFGRHHQTGDYSHKPRWRPDGYGFGEPFKQRKPIMDFRLPMVEMALNWKPHTLKTVCDLVERLHGLGEEFQVRVWELAESWAASANDTDKAALREKIRVTVLSRRGVKRAEREEMPSLTAKGRKLYNSLVPADVINRNAWLFRNNWVDESADEIQDIEEMDFQKREERIRNSRIAALKEIYAERGLDGLLKIAIAGKAAWQVGVQTVENVLPIAELPKLLKAAMPHLLVDNAGDNSEYRNLAAGILLAVNDEPARIQVIHEATYELSDEMKAKFLLLAPFRRSTWSVVETLGEKAKEQYWLEVGAQWVVNHDDENAEAVQHLLKVNRPRAAFSCLRFHPEKVKANLLYEVLREAAKDSNDKPGHYQFEQYDLEKAFKALSDSTELTLEQKAGLELTYVDTLARPWSSNDSFGVPNLEKYVEANPNQYVQFVVWAYKRADRGVDPDEWRVADDVKEGTARLGFKVLEGLERIPGHDHTGTLNADNLGRWIKTVRDKCAQLDRLDIADIALGKLLSCAPIGEDGVWPCEPVRQVMEEIQSTHIMDGAHTGLYNSRGAHFRGEGGDQERELADKYRKWADALQITHPFVAERLLMGMVRTYEREASAHDTEAGIRRRLR